MNPLSSLQSQSPTHAPGQVGEYISSLLTRAREISNEIFLKAAAASFKEAWRMVDTIVHVASTRDDFQLPKTKAEDVV